MSYNNPNPNLNPGPPVNCSSPAAAPELKLYQAFIFSIPICFTFVILFLFYLIYLRRQSVDLASLGMRSSIRNPTVLSLSTAELGLSKEVRGMLPIIVYKESFSVRDSQCAVCLGDYEADDRLQQIPTCGHTFHMDCIDRWLTSHTTCPLCRLFIIAKASPTQQLNRPSATGVIDQGASPPPPPLQSSDSVNGGSDVQESLRDLNEDGQCRETAKEREKDEGNNVGTSNPKDCKVV